jgi:hypothetical protein
MTMATSPRDKRETMTAPRVEAFSPQDRTPCTEHEADSTASSGPAGQDTAADFAATSKGASKRKATAPPPAQLSITEKPVLTISETALLGAHSPSALRHLIFNSEAWNRYPDGKYRRSIGFDRCIIRPPGQRRVFIDRVKYLQWLNSNAQVTP